MRNESALVRVRLPSGATAWAVTRHDEAQQLLKDVRVSTDPTRPGFPTLMPKAPSPAEQEAAAKFYEGQFVDMDSPQHGRYRRMLIPDFNVRRVNEMRPRMQVTVDLLIDNMLSNQNKSADLVKSFALPLSLTIICDVLGIPSADRDYFGSQAEKLTQAASAPKEAMAAVMEIRSYLGNLITASAKAPDNSLIGRLVVNQLSTGAINHNALVGMIFLLLMAGYETTGNMIPLGVLTLLQHPDQLHRVIAEPTLWPNAVEELLRYHSILDWGAFDRMALDEIKIGGEVVRAGEGIYILAAAANRDERVYEQADTFDIGRHAHNHLAFGYGMHQCLGQNLARAELEVSYRRLFERLPTLRVDAEVAELEPKHDAAVFGLHHLPIAW